MAGSYCIEQTSFREGALGIQFIDSSSLVDAVSECLVGPLECLLHGLGMNCNYFSLRRNREVDVGTQESNIRVDRARGDSWRSRWGGSRCCCGSRDAEEDLLTLLERVLVPS